MRYSFIIPVYNRPEEVDELLNSLTRQTNKNFEVLIVEDGSSVPCKEVVDNYADRLDICYYFKSNSGPGQTRNYGAERGHGEYLIILDSDCILPEGYLAAVKQSLSLEEVRKLYNSECSVPVVRKAAIFSCLSGLRISDILNLKWENIQTYADGGHYLDFKCVKTQRQTQVPIGDDAYELIQPQTTDKYIFSGFNRTMTYRVMQDWIKECGIKKHITFHCFRHTYASLQLELGTDIYTVQHLLNHKNVSTTQIYASHADPKTREAADRIRLTNVKISLRKRSILIPIKHLKMY